MDNFKIYRDRKYDIKANISVMVRKQLIVISDKIDNFFTNH